MIMRAALNMAVLQHYGLTKDQLPPRVRDLHRAIVRGAYRGSRKGYKAWLRFVRAARDVVIAKAAQ